MSRLTTSRRLALLLVTASVAACGGGDSGTQPPPPQPSFTLTLSGATLSVAQEGTNTLTANIGRGGNFAGAVNLSVSGAPTGVNATFSPSSVSSTSTSSTLTVTAAPNAAPGNYTLTVRGQATGLTDQTATVALTVTAKPAIAVTLAPTSVSVGQGGATTYTATVARTNFTGAVAVAVTGAPTGVTTTVTNAADVYTVAVAVAASAATGTYTLTTTASGTGVTAASANFTLTVAAPAAASIALSAAPAAVSIQAGGAAVTSTVTIARTNYTGAVVVAVQSGLPNGVTTVNTPSGPTTTNSVGVAFTAAASTTPGTYNVVLQGSGANVTADTVHVALTVTAAPASSVTLAASPAALTVQAGASGSTDINITRNNFAGSVQLAATGAPAGVTPTLNPATTTQNTSKLDVAVGVGAAPGTYPITVTASGTGITNASVVVNLTVTPVSSGGSITWQFCGPASELPIWVAKQDGPATAPWTQVTASSANSYSFDITTQGAVAFVTQGSNNGYTLTIEYGTKGELQAKASAHCQFPTLKTVTGTVSGFGTNNADIVSVAFGNASPTTPPSFAAPNFTINNAPDGPRDLVGTRSSFDINNPTAGLALNRIFLKRGLNPPNNGSVGTVDFGGGDAFAPDTKQVTINGIAAGEQAGANAVFITNTQTFAFLGQTLLASGSTANLFTVPSARTVAGDVHAITASAVVLSGTLASEMRLVTAAFRDPTNQTVTLGARMNAPAVTVAASAPYARLRSVAVKQSDYPDFYNASFTQVSATPRSTIITMSSAYLGSAGSFDVTVPDFTGVGGWSNAWGLQAGVSTIWSVGMTGWISGTGGLVEGSVFRTAQRQGQITP